MPVMLNYENVCVRKGYCAALSDIVSATTGGICNWLPGGHHLGSNH